MPKPGRREPREMPKAQHVTLEPCAENTDGTAVTVYFPFLTTKEQATKWILDEENQRSIPGNLGVDTESEWFSVDQIKCDFPGFVCFQYQLTC